MIRTARPDRGHTPSAGVMKATQHPWSGSSEDDLSGGQLSMRIEVG